MRHLTKADRRSGSIRSLDEADTHDNPKKCFWTTHECASLVLFSFDKDYYHSSGDDDAQRATGINDSGGDRIPGRALIHTYQSPSAPPKVSGVYQDGPVNDQPET